MSGAAPGVRVLESSGVAPPPGLVPESSLPLTFFDIEWLYSGPVQRVFFYPFPHPTSYFFDSVLPTLKSALSSTLQEFYPLAGKIRLAPGSDTKYELHYAEGDSVSFTVAEHDGDFDQLSGSHAREYPRIVPLIPQLPAPGDRGRKVMTVQVTLFPNRGVVVAVAVHHAACDGSSSTRFVTSWACRTAGKENVAPTPPFFDRSSVPNPNDLYTKFFNNLTSEAQSLESLMIQFAPPDAVVGTVTLKSDDIRKLKEAVSSKVNSFHCSTILVTYAYAWVCLVKVRAYVKDKIVHFAFPGNCRERLQPPLPAEYFGNCIGGYFTEAKAGDLMREDGFLTAARIIGEAIEWFKADPVKDAEKWPEKYQEIGLQQPLSVAGSPRFQVYDVDFGWGRPAKVDMPSITWLGAISVSDSSDEQGAVEIGLVLSKLEMESFAAHFSDDLKLF